MAPGIAVRVRSLKSARSGADTGRVPRGRRIPAATGVLEDFPHDHQDPATRGT